jgi:CHAD domain-containing protein
MEHDSISLKEIKPALAGYISESQILLSREAFPDDKVIHDVRVLMKKSRAALKLVAPLIGSEFVTRDIVALREVGRKMCCWRESTVLRKNLKELKKEFPGIFSGLADNIRINLILKKPDDTARPSEMLINEL